MVSGLSVSTSEFVSCSLILELLVTDTMHRGLDLVGLMVCINASCRELHSQTRTLMAQAYTTGRALKGIEATLLKP
jgi:superfamily II DNA/RNA helicase